MHHVPFEQRQREVVYITEPQPKPRSSGFAVAGFILSLMGFFTCFVLSPFGLLFSLLGMYKKPRGLATAGTVMGLIGTSVIGGGIFLASIEDNHYHASPQQTASFSHLNTQRRLNDAKFKIEKWRGEHDGQLPEGVEGNKMVLEIEDGWKTSISYEPDSTGYSLRSAGPDQQFDTNDDVVSRVSLRASELVNMHLQGDLSENMSSEISDAADEAEAAAQEAADILDDEFQADDDE